MMTQTLTRLRQSPKLLMMSNGRYYWIALKWNYLNLIFLLPYFNMGCVYRSIITFFLIKISHFTSQHDFVNNAAHEWKVSKTNRLIILFQTTDDSDFNPFETKSKVANDIQQVNAAHLYLIFYPLWKAWFLTLSIFFCKKLVFFWIGLQVVEDSNFNPFETKSKIVNENDQV